MRSLRVSPAALLMHVVVLLNICTNGKVIASESQEILNVRVFTKLYGYVKYFHPSDEASQIDWDKFAIYGTERVKSAQNSEELKSILEELFLPIAPTIQIYHSNEKPRPFVVPEDTTDLKVVAWQHQGVELGTSSNIYRSIRINRENRVLTTGYGFSTVGTWADATDYRGKEIKLKAFVRTNVSGTGNQGQLWLRVDRENKQRGFFDNMYDRPIKSHQWQSYEIVGTVADDATRIVFGCFLKGIGQVWVDGFQLFAKNEDGGWQTIQIKNPGFEEEADDKPKMWWLANTPGYTHKLWARVITPTANDDSFWVRMDGGSWYQRNNIGPTSSWSWQECQSYTLNAGSHTLTIAYREDGAKLDKLYIGNSTPSGTGGEAENCTGTTTTTTSGSTTTTTSGGGDDYVWLEAECGNVGSLWNILSDSSASGGYYVTIQSGNNSTGSAPSSSNGHITYNFEIQSGTYKEIQRGTYKLVSDNPYEGGRSLLIENKGESFSGTLFDAFPKVGEVINKELGAVLSCQIPLALYSDSNGTLGKGDKASFDALLEQLSKIETGNLTADNEFVRLGNIVIAWNVFQHFYPYFDVVGTDWDAELTNTLKEALSNQNEKDFYSTLRRLVAKLHDGHGGVYHKISREQAGFPFLVDWIENHVVITFVKDSNNFKVGDIVISIDSIPAEQMLLNEEEYISGSPQWKRVNSLRRFGYGKEGTTAKLQIMRNGQILKMEALRNNKEHLSEPERPVIEKIENDIFYVNLDKAEMDEIRGKINDLANAKGVIFDLRQYPRGNHEIISHLLTKPDTSSAWMRIPQIIYPDQENVVGFMKSGWRMQPKEPHIKGKVVFLTGGRAISYAESFMGFIEHYKLAEIVGQPTAGTNGNANTFELPGGFRVVWTGMRVVKHDGSQHHLIGIQPTVPVQRTIQGVIEGRDEFMEKALEIIGSD